MSESAFLGIESKSTKQLQCTNFILLPKLDGLRLPKDILKLPAIDDKIISDRLIDAMKLPNLLK